MSAIVGCEVAGTRAAGKLSTGFLIVGKLRNDGLGTAPAIIKVEIPIQSKSNSVTININNRQMMIFSGKFKL